MEDEEKAAETERRNKELEQEQAEAAEFEKNVQNLVIGEVR